MNDNLLWLLEWYHSHCDGDWEHCYGIKMGTLDNPGWHLKISIEETELENKNFQVVDIERAENDWVYCSVKAGLFEGFGGPFNLPELIQIFKNWVEIS